MCCKNTSIEFKVKFNLTKCLFYVTKWKLYIDWDEWEVQMVPIILALEKLRETGIRKSSSFR